MTYREIGCPLWLLCWLLTSISSSAQYEVDPRGDSLAVSDVSDPVLKHALEQMKEMQVELRVLHRRELISPKQAGELYQDPKRFGVIMGALEAYQKVNPEDSSRLAVRESLGEVINAAVHSKRPEVMPLLKKLAWSDVDFVRDKMASADAYTEVSPQPVELMLEIVKSAEARLPAKVDVNDPEGLKLFREFDARLSKFCHNGPVSSRAEVEPIMQRVLEKYRGTDGYRFQKEKFESLRKYQPQTLQEILRESERRRIYGRFSPWTWMGGTVAAVLLLLFAAWGTVWWMRRRQA